MIWLDVACLAAGVNILFLVTLSSIWVRNFRQFRSKHTLGLATFGGLLLLENVIALYVFLWHPVLSGWIASSAPVAQTAMMVLRALESGALGVLLWTTWD